MRPRRDFCEPLIEQYYQSVRRCWRFGQKRPVTVDLVLSEGERNIQANLRKKAANADRMFTTLVNEMGAALDISAAPIGNERVRIPAWQ